jgi:hypothetical protein
MPLKTNIYVVEVLKTEEKGSDVNIAAHLVNDAHKGRFEAAVLITNDSDLLTPMQIVRRELKEKPVLTEKSFAAAESSFFGLRFLHRTFIVFWHK